MPRPPAPPPDASRARRDAIQPTPLAQRRPCAWSQASRRWRCCSSRRSTGRDHRDRFVPGVEATKSRRREAGVERARQEGHGSRAVHTGGHPGSHGTPSTRVSNHQHNPAVGVLPSQLWVTQPSPSGRFGPSSVTPSGGRDHPNMNGVRYWGGPTSFPFFERSGSVHAERSKQQGRRLPPSIFEIVTATRRSRVAGFPVAFTQRTHSQRAIGVISLHSRLIL